MTNFVILALLVAALWIFNWKNHGFGTGTVLTAVMLLTALFVGWLASVWQTGLLIIAGLLLFAVIFLVN